MADTQIQDCSVTEFCAKKKYLFYLHMTERLQHAAKNKNKTNFLCNLKWITIIITEIENYY
jgi:hypothetical protein